MHLTEVVTTSLWVYNAWLLLNLEQKSLIILHTLLAILFETHCIPNFSFLDYVEVKRTISGYLRLYLAILGYLELPRDISGSLGLFWVISGSLWLCQAISDYLQISPTISDYLGLSQAISGYLGLSRTTSGYLALPRAISSYPLSISWSLYYSETFWIIYESISRTSSRGAFAPKNN